MPERLLLLAPKFYGMELEIYYTLENLGYDVSYVENKILKFDYHGKNSKFILFRRLYYLTFRPDVRYINSVFSTMANTRYDILLAINCHSVCQYLFKLLKKANPSIRSVLFLWDSMSNYSWQKETKLFDKSYSFDRKDSCELGIKYKPNFYIDKEQKLKSVIEHHVFFAGKFNLKRLKILDKIWEKGSLCGINLYFILWAGSKRFFHNNYIYRILKPFSIFYWINDFLSNYEAIEKILTRDFLVHEPLDLNEIRKHLHGSNVVLDINYAEQNGYSQRIIEALSLGKKIITTNYSIQEEEYYNKNQIKVISTGFDDVDINWILESKTFPVPDSIKKLELSEWLLSVIDAKNSFEAA